MLRMVLLLVFGLVLAAAPCPAVAQQATPSRSEAPVAASGAPSGPPAGAPSSAAPASPNDTTPASGNALRLYSDGFAASYLPVPGFVPVKMPVRDATEGAPGCYIACASHDKRGSIYAPDPNTFVVGAVRVMGNYQDGVCRPGGQDRTDLTSDMRLSELCALAIPTACEGKRCFATGDTGRWVPPGQSLAASTNPTNTGNENQSCVLACYSHNRENALYEVSSDTFAIGGFQTTGHYENDVCKPKNFETADIGGEDAFKRRCTELFPKQCANDSCWVNGDTRGRLGSS